MIGVCGPNLIGQLRQPCPNLAVFFPLRRHRLSIQDQYWVDAAEEMLVA